MHITLSQWSLLLSGLLLAPAMLALAAPALASRLGRGFARDAWTGRILSAAAWIWSGWALYVMPLELLEPVRQWIPLLALIAIPLTWWWMPELLSCRAAGGLLTLFPCPLLLVARVHPSEWRLVLVSLAYISIVAGMDFILYPYHLRRALAWITARPARVRVTALASAILGAAFIGLAFSVLA